MTRRNGKVSELWQRNLEADGRFGHFLWVPRSGIDPDAPETRDDRFEFGLDCVLDGIAKVAGRIVS